MFHGLVYLPIILSLVGPAPYASSEPESSPKEKNMELESKPNVVANGNSEVKGMSTLFCFNNFSGFFFELHFLRKGYGFFW